MTDERPLDQRIPELRSALEKLNAAPADADVQFIELTRPEIDALIRMYGQTRPMARPELEEVAVLKLPIGVAGMSRLVQGLQQVYDEPLFLPRWHQHGDGHLVLARRKKEGPDG